MPLLSVSCSFSTHVPRLYSDGFALNPTRVHEAEVTVFLLCAPGKAVLSLKPKHFSVSCLLLSFLLAGNVSYSKKLCTAVRDRANKRVQRHSEQEPSHAYLDSTLHYPSRPCLFRGTPRKELLEGLQSMPGEKASSPYRSGYGACQKPASLLRAADDDTDL